LDVLRQLTESFLARAQGPFDATPLLIPLVALQRKGDIHRKFIEQP
jgi:hypothetical protein